MDHDGLHISTTSIQWYICTCMEIEFPPEFLFPTHLGNPLLFSQLQRPLLIGGLEHFLFFHKLGIIIPTDSTD